MCGLLPKDWTGTDHFCPFLNSSYNNSGSPIGQNHHQWLINVRHVLQVVIDIIILFIFLNTSSKGAGVQRNGQCWNGHRGSSRAWVELLALHLKTSFGEGGCFLVACYVSPTFRHAVWKYSPPHSCYHGFSYSVIHGLRLNNERWWKKHFTLFLSLCLSLDCHLVLDSYWTGSSPASVKSIILGEKSLKWHLIFNNANANWKWLADLY